MAEQGWIKLGRGITAHWIWDRPLYLKWWLDMVMMAGWGPRRQVISGKLVTIGRGQFVASYSYLCQRWEYRRETMSGEGRMMRPSEKTIYKFLRLLEGEGMITREPKNNVVGTTLITICDYDKYSTISEDSNNGVDGWSDGGALRASDGGACGGSGGAAGGGIDREWEGDPGGDAGHGRGSGRGSESAQQKKNIKKVKKEKEEYNPPSPREREVENFQNIPPVPPEWPEVREYFHDISAVREFRSWEGAARKFYDHFSAAGWRDAKNRPIADWQARANLWIEEDINKPKKSDRNGEQAKTMGAADRRRPAEPPRAGTADWDAAF